MAMLTRYDPFREMMSLRDAMNRLFEESFVRPNGWMMSLGSTAAPVDVMETDDKYVVTASLPGWKPEDVNITVTENTVTISGEYNPVVHEGAAGKTYHVRERRYASFNRSFTFPTPVDADKADAHFENGVLTLTLPKSESAKPKRIPVNGQQKQLTGTSSR